MALTQNLEKHIGEQLLALGVRNVRIQKELDETEQLVSAYFSDLLLALYETIDVDTGCHCRRATASLRLATGIASRGRSCSARRVRCASRAACR